jgi:hypothetical protein
LWKVDTLPPIGATLAGDVRETLVGCHGSVKPYFSKRSLGKFPGQFNEMKKDNSNDNCTKIFSN